MQHKNTSLSNQKLFLNGINYLLKNKKPTLFYCNQYVPLLKKNKLQEKHQRRQVSY
jgi:hypothetical protein